MPGKTANFSELQAALLRNATRKGVSIAQPKIHYVGGISGLWAKGTANRFQGASIVVYVDHKDSNSHGLNAHSDVY